MPLGAKWNDLAGAEAALDGVGDLVIGVDADRALDVVDEASDLAEELANRGVLDELEEGAPTALNGAGDGVDDGANDFHDVLYKKCGLDWELT